MEVLAKWAMRSAACTHWSSGATSAIRMRPWPGLALCASRASRLPGSTVTPVRAIELARKRRIRAGRARPQVERSLWRAHIQYVLQDGQHGFELGAILAPVFLHMRLIGPRSDAGGRNNRAHGAAMVGAVQQEARQQRGVAGHEPRTHAGHVRTLDRLENATRFV